MGNPAEASETTQAIAPDHPAPRIVEAVGKAGGKRSAEAEGAQIAAAVGSAAGVGSTSVEGALVVPAVGQAAGVGKAGGSGTWARLTGEIAHKALLLWNALHGLRGANLDRHNAAITVRAEAQMWFDEMRRQNPRLRDHEIRGAIAQRWGVSKRTVRDWFPLSKKK